MPILTSSLQSTSEEPKLVISILMFVMAELYELQSYLKSDQRLGGELNVGLCM